VVNDVTSNGEIVVGRELELREALLKFRGPRTSEEWRGEGDDRRWGSMVSFSGEKDERGGDEELRKRP
jgi:hypothetical protein